MGFLNLVLLFMVLVFFFSEGCGIKKPPKPPPRPEFQVRRIGDLVYVIPTDGNVVVEGFERAKGFWVLRREERFCFKVSHVKGKSVLQCVEEAPKGRPEAKVEVLRDRVVVRLKGFRSYRVYPVKDDLIPVPVMESNGEVVLRRSHVARRFGITGVVDGVETEPLFVEVPPVETERPEKPKDLKYTVKGNRIVIFWRGEEGMRYLVYRNDTLLTEEPILVNVFVDRLPEPGTVYRVISVNDEGVRSEPAQIVYRP